MYDDFIQSGGPAAEDYRRAYHRTSPGESPGHVKSITMTLEVWSPDPEENVRALARYRETWVLRQWRVEAGD